MKSTDIIAIKSPKVVVRGTITLSPSNPRLKVIIPSINDKIIERLVVKIPIKTQART